MSKFKIALTTFFKKICGYFRLPECRHYYMDHDHSRSRDEHYERVHRYGGFRAM